MEIIPEYRMKKLYFNDDDEFDYEFMYNSDNGDQVTSRTESRVNDRVKEKLRTLLTEYADWKLFDKRNPIPNIETSENFSKYLLAVPMYLACSSNTEPPLPENYLPHRSIRPIQVLEQTSEAPSIFMDEMQIVHQHNAKTLRLSLLSARIGLYCVAPFMYEYHWAIIIKIYDDEIVRVFYYIHYGTIAEVQIQWTCLLHHDFAGQAIRACLANIIPTRQNTMWPREAARCMMQLIMEKTLVALISAIDYEQQIL
ncbi:hypothetical protein CBL_02978 [Carabus blaptoides fortunei]